MVGDGQPQQHFPDTVGGQKESHAVLFAPHLQFPMGLCFVSGCAGESAIGHIGLMTGASVPRRHTWPHCRYCCSYDSAKADQEGDLRHAWMDLRPFVGSKNLHRFECGPLQKRHCSVDADLSAWATVRPCADMHWWAWGRGGGSAPGRAVPRLNNPHAPRARNRKAPAVTGGTGLAHDLGRQGFEASPRPQYTQCCKPYPPNTPLRPKCPLQPRPINTQTQIAGRHAKSARC